jgi:hypothetical protein
MFKAILIFVLVSPLMILPQTASDSSETFSRLKLSIGYFGGKYVAVGKNTFFMNLNYRASTLLKYKDNPQFGFAFEAGVNVIKGVFPFYAKVGPELAVVNNLILAGNVGYLGIFIYPAAPFYGVNGFYLIPLSKTTNLEIEGGFHSSFGVEPLYYLSFGISFE